RAPSLAADESFRDWWATYLRMGASPGAAVALTKMNAEIDVREVLPSVRVPTLVIHRTGDRCLKVEEGRFVASQISGAKFVELPGDDHLPFVGDQDEMLGEIERFVAGVHAAEDHDRVLATVMSISFADSNGELRRRGLESWSGFVAASRQFVHNQLTAFRGKAVSVGDDETLAAFDGPARAVRCASAIKAAAERQGVRLKIGLHTGECDVTGETYGGFAVGLAHRIAQLSDGQNILVSRTVKDLVAGSGLAFTEFGTRSFDGIEGTWRLFTVGSPSEAAPTGTASVTLTTPR
ncbi:MAG TPA: adenylate/guanylate cyclase domain-containing protein, partial [Pyrinomonadaceae bacterium]|nr:adenylate/guanylate cyclase domain-containing protein [Pyrinomonadaceae bacterium]